MTKEPEEMVDYDQLPALAPPVIERVRALWRNLAWCVVPEAFGNDDGEVPNAGDASLLAMVRGLHSSAPPQTAVTHRDKAQQHLDALLATGPVSVLSPTEGDSRRGCRLDLACELLDVRGRDRLALELITVTAADPVTAQAARTLAGRLGHAANDIAVMSDCFAAAGLGAGVIMQVTGTGGTLQQIGAVWSKEGRARPSDTVLAFLDGRLDARSALDAQRFELRMPVEVLQTLSGMRSRWLAVMDRALQSGRPVLVSGMAGFGGPAMVALLAINNDLSWRALHASPLVDSGLGADNYLFSCLHAEARLSGAIQVLHRLDRAEKQLRDDPDSLRKFVDFLLRIERPITLIWEGPLPPGLAARFAIEGGLLHIEVPPLTVQQRGELMASSLRSLGVDQPDAQRLATNASHYSLGAEQIVSACAFAQQRASVRAAAAVAEQRDSGPNHPTVLELRHACATAMTNRLRAYGSRVETSQSWEDLVLAEEPLAQVKELSRFARVRDRLFNELGFGSKMEYGRALSAMFSGHSGTGKTMVAGLIARDLGVELYRVDLSRVVSKYIGETEQRLGALFDEATQVGAALLFDEADSLFGKRTEIKSSHDRYANLEVNYLLQRLEEFDGVVILTTNFSTSIDDAFVRRLRFRVQFPFPGIAERGRLWAVMLPDELPRDDDDPLDLEWMGEAFELSGGHIKNAALRAGILAADADKPLGMRMLYDAAAAEYRELGKIAPPYPFDDDGDEDW